MTSARTKPIAFGAAHHDLLTHLHAERFPVPSALIESLSAVCPIQTDAENLAEASRDWWPIAMHWALAGSVPQMPSVVVAPRTTEEVSKVLQLCNAAKTPVTTSAGRSGVSGAAVPVYGGVVLDTAALTGVVDIDPDSGVIEVLPGTFGPELEDAANAAGLTVGHFPQSFDISTVGGWVACRGAGQFSTRYGKIEDMVIGLEVVLADGKVITTGGAPAAADGPDLTGIFIGSEGMLGVITRVWLRTHQRPTAKRKAAFSFPDFAAGIEAARRTIREGATPAVLRLYDGFESKRSHSMDGQRCTLIAYDEGSEAMVDATMTILGDQVIACGGREEDSSLVDNWFEHRNDTTALQALTQKGFVVDTMEVSGEWSRLANCYKQVQAAALNVEHSRVASCHLSHSYPDGACLYFTFAASPPPEFIESTYVAVWDAAQNAALDAGANLSHHHGIGLNRARFVRRALGQSFELLAELKRTLDPNGVLNPGKFGLDSNFGSSDQKGVPWP